MIRQSLAFVVATGMTLAAAGQLRAQEQSQPAAQPAAQTRAGGAGDPSIPLRVVVVISSFQAEKKVSSLTYLLSVNANESSFPPRVSQLRMGAEIPISGMVPPTVDGKAIPGVPTGGGPVTYKAIGTNVDCSATALKDGRFELTISIEDSSIVNDQATKTAPKAGEPPIFRSFRLANRVILRDGQSSQFTAATDRISGEVIKVDVTLTVIK